MKTHSGKDKGHTIFWDMKGPIATDLLAKTITLNNSFFYCQLLKQNLPYSLNKPHIYNTLTIK